MLPQQDNSNYWNKTLNHEEEREEFPHRVSIITNEEDINLYI